MHFQLDATLAADSILIETIGDFMFRLVDDSRYIWVLVIPTINGVSEIHDLNPIKRHQLADHSAYLGEALTSEFNGDKFNVAAIGNKVPQLHIHHIVRKTTDAAWPNPVWGHSPATPYTKSELQNILIRLNKILHKVT